MKNRSFKRALAVVSVAATAAALTAFGVAPPSEASESTTAPWTVSVTPNTSITDGQLVSINIQTTTDHRIYEANAQICRLGVDYKPSDGDRPAEDFTPGDLNCPSIPISSSSDVQTGDGNLYTPATEPGGSTFSMFVGSGVVEWPATSNGRTQSLTCNSENPCALVVEVYGSVAPGVARWYPYVQKLEYRVDDPIAGCGGPADAVLSTAAPERVTDVWVNWTLDQCRQDGVQAGAASRASFTDEGEAMNGFSGGTLDMAYSALGYESGPALGRGSRTEPLTPRASTAVPLALNATVVAVGNGRRGPNDRKIPFTDVRLTVDQVAYMFSGGPTIFNANELAAFVEANPQFAEASVFLPAAIQVGAFAPADASSWFLTSFLKANRPEIWIVPDTNQFGAEKGLTRSASVAFGVANPSFNGALDIFTGNSTFVKTIRSQNLDSYGGIWYLTDLATAKRLGLAVASIENGNGDYVTPTAESMAAAVPTMTTTSDGRLLPDPTATVDKDAVQPYPLTFVDYAIAPTSKLVDSKCKGRTLSQSLLNTWLNYAVTDGQSKLPDGYVPLTDDLKATATDAIAKVGSEEPDCFIEGDPLPVTAPAGGGGSGGGGAGGGGIRNPGITPAVVAGSDTTNTATGTINAEVASAEVPEFTSRSAASAAAAFGGIIFVFGLLSLMAMATTGRLPSMSTIRSRMGGVGR
jgi:ABC-type phosphate transport system substrate-binding protein